MRTSDKFRVWMLDVELCSFCDKLGMDGKHGVSATYLIW